MKNNEFIEHFLDWSISSESMVRLVDKHLTAWNNCFLLFQAAKGVCN